MSKTHTHGDLTATLNERRGTWSIRASNMDHVGHIEAEGKDMEFFPYNSTLTHDELRSIVALMDAIKSELEVR